MQLWPAKENAFAASFVGGEVEVGVRGDDDGRRVAELQPHALLRRALRDAPADAARAGERDHPDALVLDEHVADLAGRADEDGEPARRGGPLPARAPRGAAPRAASELAGLSTTGQPAASAGASLCATRLHGKLKGEMAPMMPTGRRSVNAIFPSPASEAPMGTTSPASLRASTAAKVYVETAREASTRAVLIGLPASAQIVCAMSSLPLAQQPRDAVEDRCALVRRQRRLERARGRVDCPARVVGAGLRHPADDLAAVRGVDLDPFFESSSPYAQPVLTRDDIAIHLTCELVVDGATWPCFSHTIEHPDGLVLVDTGMIESTPELDEHLPPDRAPAAGRSSSSASRTWSSRTCTSTITARNRLFPGIPIHVQRIELEDARTTETTTRSASGSTSPARTTSSTTARRRSCRASGSCRRRGRRAATRSSSWRPTRGRSCSAATSATRSGRSGEADTPGKRLVLELAAPTYLAHVREPHVPHPNV